MKMSFWLGTFVSLWLLSLSGMASPLEDKVNALRAAMKADASSANPLTTPSTSSGYPAVMSEAAEEEILKQIASGQTSQLPGNYAAIIHQILSTHSSEAVQKAGLKLLEEIEAERKVKADAYASKVTGVLNRLADVITKSTKPSDLDEILVELQKYQSSGYPVGDEDQQRLFQKATMAYQFATGWQDYLSSLANGNVDQARNELRSLAQNGYGITIVPRSHILELMNAPMSVPAKTEMNAPSTSGPTVNDILNHVETLDQMEDALKQIDALNIPPGSTETGTIQTLQNYVQCYHDIKAGLPANLDLRNGIQALPKHEDITRKVWLLALQALFPSFKGAPLLDEKPLYFVNRVIADAASREDWDLLKKALETKDSVTKSTQFGLYVPDPTSGLNSLISALNQEAAGQYSLAVVSYEAALKSPSLDIPAKMIGEKLAAIKKDHPSDYEKGYQQTISPPMPYFNPNMPYRPGMPGYPYPYPSRMPASTILSIPGQSNPAGASGSAATNQVLSPAVPVTNSTTPPAPSGK